MTLFDKIQAIYPDLTFDDFDLVAGTILLRNDCDDRGDYIARWEHSVYPMPTEQQLAEVVKKL
jgi:hypothetical protein